MPDDFPNHRITVLFNTEKLLEMTYEDIVKHHDVMDRYTRKVWHVMRVKEEMSEEHIVMEPDIDYTIPEYK
jgi:hypothetical protein